MMKSRAAVALLAASIKAAVMPALFKSIARQYQKASARLDEQLKPATPFVPLFGWGRESKGPHPRHPMYPHNHYATKWHPSARHGAQECARRRRQIEYGQLRRENGLAI